MPSTCPFFLCLRLRRILGITKEPPRIVFSSAEKKIASLLPKIRFLEIPYIQDLEAAKHFYQTVMGVELTQLPTPPENPPMEMWAFPMQDGAAGAAGAIVKMDGVESGSGGSLIYFTLEDCAVAFEKVAEAGGTPVREKFSIGEHGFIALAQDPDGNTIGLHSMS